MHNNNGHLVASVFVEDDKKYRHDDNGSEQYESVAYRLKEAIANATCLAIVLKWSVDATAESKQINRQTMKKKEQKFYTGKSTTALPHGPKDILKKFEPCNKFRSDPDKKYRIG